MQRVRLWILLVVLSGTGVAQAAATGVPTIEILNIHAGDVLHNPVTLQFAAHGVTISPAGDMTPNSGHYHLLVDTALTPEQMKAPIPKDDQHIHYGKGQTEATLTLPKGQHTLQLVLGDGAHRLHQPAILTQPVTVIVE